MIAHTTTLLIFVLMKIRFMTKFHCFGRWVLTRWFWPLCGTKTCVFFSALNLWIGFMETTESEDSIKNRLMYLSNYNVQIQRHGVCLSKGIYWSWLWKWFRLNMTLSDFPINRALKQSSSSLSSKQMMRSRSLLIGGKLPPLWFACRI